MTQPLNFSPKALSDIVGSPCPDAPGTAAGMRYLAAKLREAQVFVLSDSGQLLDREKPRPEVPGLMFKPPFPVVALEYLANPVEWGESAYTASRSTKRIALAWEWSDDLPPILRSICPAGIGPGVVIASIPYYDDRGLWLPIAAAIHLPFDGEWKRVEGTTAFKEEMLAVGRLKPAQARAPQYPTTPIPLFPEVMARIAHAAGGIGGMLDLIAADCMDEVNAYQDLCIALACRNVTTERHAAPPKLNKARAAAGKPLLKDFHVLNLADGGAMPAAGTAGGGSRRAHLRRGHIRRLPGDRVTWVNQTMVSGKAGFVDKVYSL